MKKTVPLNFDGWQVYKRLYAYVRPYRKMFMLGTLGAALFAAANTSVIGFVKYFWDDAFFKSNPTIALWAPLGVVLIFLVRGLGDFMQTYWMGYVGRRVVQDLRVQAFSYCMRLPISFFDRSSAADLLSRLTYNTELVAQSITDSIVVAIRETLTIVVALSYLFYLNPKLTGLALIAGPIVGWLASIISKLFRKYSHRIQQSMGDVMRVAKETLEAPRTIKVFNAHDYQSAQFLAVADHNRRSNMKLVLTRSLSNPIVQFIGSLGLAAVLFVATREVLQSGLTVGTFTAVIVGLAQIMQPLRNLINVSGPLQQGIAAGHSIFELLDTPEEVSSGTTRIERARGAIELRSVSFDYNVGKGIALDNVNLQIKPGETIAIVGKSGSGKSTLVSLVPRFYDPTTGSVMIDGVDTREYDLTNLRSQISLVSQDVVLFNDSIRNNIAFGSNASDEAIEKAATLAHVMEFVREKPDGLQTQVGDRGIMLSGGQKQRISIARALLRNTPILILDEATSALDTESERVIQTALTELMHNRTTLVIAHRLSTVENADRIVVMNAGSIVEVGTHAELLAKDGYYAALHRMQFSD